MQEFVRRLMRDYSLPDGQIDWKKFHRIRRKIKEDQKKDRDNKKRYRKYELSDEERDDLT